MVRLRAGDASWPNPTLLKWHGVSQDFQRAGVSGQHGSIKGTTRMVMYPSSHKNGSEKWIPPKVGSTFWIWEKVYCPSFQVFEVLEDIFFSNADCVSTSLKISSIVWMIPFLMPKLMDVWGLPQTSAAIICYVEHHPMIKTLETFYQNSAQFGYLSNYCTHPKTDQLLIGSCFAFDSDITKLLRLFSFKSQSFARMGYTAYHQLDNELYIHWPQSRGQWWLITP